MTYFFKETNRETNGCSTRTAKNYPGPGRVNHGMYAALICIKLSTSAESSMLCQSPPCANNDQLVWNIVCCHARSSSVSIQ
jgi:hypothetical protein